MRPGAPVSRPPPQNYRQSPYAGQSPRAKQSSCESGQVLGPSVAPQKKLQHLNYLDSHPYHNVSVVERENASKLLESEMHIVKNRIAHGNLSLKSTSLEKISHSSHLFT